jgi:hypothetical protein
MRRRFNAVELEKIQQTVETDSLLLELRRIRRNILKLNPNSLSDEYKAALGQGFSQAISELVGIDIKTRLRMLISIKDHHLGVQIGHQLPVEVANEVRSLGIVGSSSTPNIHRRLAIIQCTRHDI